MEYDDDYSSQTMTEQEPNQKTFSVKGYEKRVEKLTRGNATTTKLNLPADWVGRTVTIILQD
jgi:hypothetical protein